MNEKLREFFIMSEQDYATTELQVLAGNKAGKVSAKAESDFMYSRGAYDTCKNIAKILDVKYHFLFK